MQRSCRAVAADRLSVDASGRPRFGMQCGVIIHSVGCKNPMGAPSIDLYTWSTPNGWKASCTLEELGIPYALHPVDIMKSQQWMPEYLQCRDEGRHRYPGDAFRLGPLGSRHPRGTLSHPGCADQYVELCLRRPRWITGDTIQVDGGSRLSSRRCAGMSPRINGKRDLNHGNEPA
jgi:hypothetical protein